MLAFRRAIKARVPLFLRSSFKFTFVLATEFTETIGSDESHGLDFVPKNMTLYEVF